MYRAYSQKIEEIETNKHDPYPFAIFAIMIQFMIITNIVIDVNSCTLTKKISLSKKIPSPQRTKFVFT